MPAKTNHGNITITSIPMKEERGPLTFAAFAFPAAPLGLAAKAPVNSDDF
jgi:hypothetical protein